MMAVVGSALSPFVDYFRATSMFSGVLAWFFIFFFPFCLPAFCATLVIFWQGGCCFR
ncbi:hypothetical protein BDV38DRAFT_266576 [Aspergillus pseudotamarii]|uniref:Uncharacterized protein n=1 Tax=Aspergillus pseudotamarii TaxID=132259 RepID=A0A5N6S9P1_ASPPS|nr:uncharacterized protein BDV38DRAFT_266576 [Aspergillus pseudotamarii]KAE8130697.1 hypothetical protein BDV38DRAFT_266576 [Aspergillus pseudotamarii]